MAKLSVCLGMALALSMTGSTAVLAQTASFSFLYTNDNPDNVERMREFTEKYEQDHPGVDIDFVSKGYSAVMQQLPMQLAVGQGPDIAAVTDNTLSRYALNMTPYMDDPQAFLDLHGNSLSVIRSADMPDDAITGFITSQTLNMPFVNVTLFEQAGVDVPKPGSTLDDIVQASVKVAEATGVDIPFTLDRSGHRLSGPALSYGSQMYVDGKWNFPDEPGKKLIADLYGYTQTGAFPKEMWGAAGGSRYKSMGAEFAAGNVVTYLSGNWMVGSFDTDIGDAFEWTAIEAPCGPGGCVPMSGSGKVMAFAHTKYPEEVAHFIEYLGSEPVQRALAEEFVTIPGAQIADLKYQSDNPNVINSMNVFNANTSKVPDMARQMEVAAGNTAFYTGIVGRISQLIVGELTLEETYDTIARDIAKINEEVAAAD